LIIVKFLTWLKTSDADCSPFWVHLETPKKDFYII
jgi:hypothetical protein